jgi:dephospho-CoA kinase
LEGIVHPYVAAELKKELNALRREKAEVVVLDVPLLFESGFDRMTDIAIVVKADRATQIARSMKRLSLPRGEAIRRIRAQMPIKEKMRRADIVIDNKGSSGETRKQVNRVWDMLRRRYFKI